MSVALAYARAFASGAPSPRCAAAPARWASALSRQGIGSGPAAFHGMGWGSTPTSTPIAAFSSPAAAGSRSGEIRSRNSQSTIHHGQSQGG